jgi:hypothetical protein
MNGVIEVGCFLTNYRDYSVGTYLSAPISKVTLIRDDGSKAAISGFNRVNNSENFLYIDQDTREYYVGLFFSTLYQVSAIDRRAAGKRYTCKYEMVGFNGETLVHTEIVQIPLPYTPTPTPTPTPSPSPIPTVTPDAFCATAGAIGKSTNGTLYTCKTSDTDARYRWR